jgi:hypothetical protein
MKKPKMKIFKSSNISIIIILSKTIKGCHPSTKQFWTNRKSEVYHQVCNRNPLIRMSLLQTRKRTLRTNFLSLNLTSNSTTIITATIKIRIRKRIFFKWQNSLQLPLSRELGLYPRDPKLQPNRAHLKTLEVSPPSRVQLKTVS